MPDLPTRVDLFNIGASEVISRSQERPVDQRLSADQIFVPGSDINLIIAASSAMAEEDTRQLAQRLAALFLDSAVGEDLDRLVSDRFSPLVVRKAAQPALVNLVFSRSAGLFPAVNLPIGTQFRTSEGTEFTITAPLAMPAASTGPITVPAEATQAGTQGNVAPDTITEFMTPPSDPNLRVTNPETAAGGDDQETDARLRLRARDFFRTARRGTVAAIEFGALTVSGIRQATAVEETTVLGEPTGRVSLFIADANGQANAALVSAVTSALIEFRGAGVIVDVFGAVPVFVEILLRLRFETGIDSTVAFESVRSAVVAAVNALRPNAILPVSLITTAARSVPGVIVLDDAVVAPVGDIIPALGQVIRTTPDRVNAE